MCTVSATKKMVVPVVKTSLKWIAPYADWGWAFGISPKCGSSSIRYAIQNEGYDYKRVDPNHYDNRLFVIRDPVQRFISLWKNKCRDGQKIAIKKHEGNHPVQGFTPNQLFEYIQTHDNHHWTPQHRLLGEITAQIVVIDQMETWWAKFPHSTLKYPRTNVTAGELILDPDLEAQIREYYEGDYDLFSRISKTAPS